ncbi:MAG: chromate efflux transporter [Gemmatimonadota bacterium]
MSDSSQSTEAGPPPHMGTLARVFLRISLLGFGGPNAHLALMLDEVVDRRKWITREHFLHLVGVTNLLPGPNSSEVAIHIGYTQRGWKGALTTGLAFLLPTFFLVVLFSALYFRYGNLPQVEGVFWGLKPAVLAIILAAGWKLAGAALEPRSLPLRALALGGVATALFLDRWEVAAMALGGAAGWALFRTGPRNRTAAPDGDGTTSLSALLLLPASGLLGTLSLPPLLHLFGLMLGTGAVLFGGGYMLVALLEPFVVEAYGWLTPQQFLDGIALTQAVPGPIVTLVAFVGYAVAGAPGAALATAGIYLPSFAAVLAVAPHLERWRKREGIKAALKGVNAVVAGAILGVGLTLIPSAVQDGWSAALALLALAALVGLRARAIWVVGGGVVAGLLHLLLTG